MQAPGTYKVLIIEDNPGDVALVENFLKESIASPLTTHAKNFKKAKEVLLSTCVAFDVILLDLSLPDKNGEQLICEIIEISLNAPIIVLTGHSDFAFSVKSLSLGISDYLLKDELTPMSLYKSIAYSIGRKKAALAQDESEKRYSDLFHLSPLPAWVVAQGTSQFLDVNTAAIVHYGYTRDEFLSMPLSSLSPVAVFPQQAAGGGDACLTAKNIFEHQKKDGGLICVELEVANLQLNGVAARLVIATDITSKLNYIKAIELQNEKLREIAWMQSHLVRAPLARIMGLVDMIKNMEKGPEEKEKYIEHILTSAEELDQVIRGISDKTRVTPL
jgi:PAS domain S-box-containing protein